jgi:hypothetical protein
MGENLSVGGGIHSACEGHGNKSIYGALLLIMEGHMLMTSSNLDTHAYLLQMTMFIVQLTVPGGTDA